MQAVTAYEMARLDSEAIEKYGINGTILMENAGSRAFEIINLQVQTFKTKPQVLVFVGTGNNGGDGLVIARYCVSHQLNTTVIFFDSNEIEFEKKLKHETLVHYQITKKFSLRWLSIESFLKKEKDSFSSENLIIVDAIFGTGLTRNVEGIYAEAITWMNEKKVSIFAIDIPSGIDANTGNILGTAVKANETITFAFPKIGHYQYPGKKNTGNLHIVDIGIPRFLLNDHVQIYSEVYQPNLPLSYHGSFDAHKGKKGHLLVWSGSLEKPGAAHLVCRSAFRSGAGLVSLLAELCPSEISGLSLQKDHEVMLQFFQSNDSFIDISTWLEKKSCIVIGPGLADNEQNVTRMKNILSHSQVPMVIDATGLDLLKKAFDDNPRILSDRQTHSLVITPHVGEMSRLLEKKISEIQKDRVNIAQHLAKKWQAIVVLKGAQTVIASYDGKTAINDIDEIALSTAGSGDVLSGMLAAICGRSGVSFENVAFAVFLHAIAGRIASENLHQHSVMASDIINNIHKAFKKYF